MHRKRRPPLKPFPLNRTDGQDPFSSRSLLAAVDHLSSHERLSARLATLLAADPGVKAIAPATVSFTQPGLSNDPLLRYRPTYLVTRHDGTTSYCDVSNVLMDGRDLARAASWHASIEAQCRILGSDFEMWTELEIGMDLSKPQIMRVATEDERAEYLSAEAERDRHDMFAIIADHLWLADLRPVGGGVVGKSKLTGILMALLTDVVADPESRMLLWRPLHSTQDNSLDAHSVARRSGDERKRSRNQRSINRSRIPHKKM
jgi:hypothetical protein